MITRTSCDEFLQMLASKAPVPGGGGASALVGAIGTALASMVANLTVGKKKYAEYEDEIIEITKKAEVLRITLLELIKRDIEVFEPLSQAYSLPKETEEQKKNKDIIMEAALKKAALVPLEIMEKTLEAIAFHEELAIKGSKIAISDVGVGVIFCKAAIMGASLNVFINTKLMKDREFAVNINEKADAILKEALPRADSVYAIVESSLK